MSSKLITLSSPQRHLNYTPLSSYVKIYTSLPSYSKHIRKYFTPLLMSYIPLPSYVKIYDLLPQ